MFDNGGIKTKEIPPGQYCIIHRVTDQDIFYNTYLPSIWF
jgi:DNA gyrase inhibitor GyrI